jgi:hypothetical protein
VWEERGISCVQFDPTGRYVEVGFKCGYVRITNRECDGDGKLFILQMLRNKQKSGGLEKEKGVLNEELGETTTHALLCSLCIPLFPALLPSVVYSASFTASTQAYTAITDQGCEC